MPDRQPNYPGVEFRLLTGAIGPDLIDQARPAQCVGHCSPIAAGAPARCHATGGPRCAGTGCSIGLVPVLIKLVRLGRPVRCHDLGTSVSSA